MFAQQYEIPTALHVNYSSTPISHIPVNLWYMVHPSSLHADAMQPPTLEQPCICLSSFNAPLKPYPFLHKNLVKNYQSTPCCSVLSSVYCVHSCVYCDLN